MHCLYFVKKEEEIWGGKIICEGGGRQRALLEAPDISPKMGPGGAGAGRRGGKEENYIKDISMP